MGGRQPLSSLLPCREKGWGMLTWGVQENKVEGKTECGRGYRRDSVGVPRGKAGLERRAMKKVMENQGPETQAQQTPNVDSTAPSNTNTDTQDTRNHKMAKRPQDGKETKAVHPPAENAACPEGETE